MIVIKKKKLKIKIKFVNRLNAEECKRRTLQRSDISSAIKKLEMFDFLIDIVPREEKVTVKSEKV